MKAQIRLKIFSFLSLSSYLYAENTAPFHLSLMTRISVFHFKKLRRVPCLVTIQKNIIVNFFQKSIPNFRQLLVNILIIT